MALQTQPIPPQFFVQHDDTAVVWLGNAGALIQSRGTVVLIDPLIAMIERNGREVLESGHRLKRPLPITAGTIPRVDAMLCTHTDIDHFGAQTAAILDQRLKPLFAGPPPVCARLNELNIPPERIRMVHEENQFAIGCITVTVTPALHDWNPEHPFRREDCCGFLLETPGGTIWHPGDTRLLDEHLAIQGVDVLFFDVADARAHLGPAGSAQLAASCGAGDLIAYHYGTLDVAPGGPFGSDPDRCLPLIADLDARFLRLNPGEPLRFNRLG